MVTWIEDHPGLAAWVQAIGSIVAIFVAIGVAAWQAHVSREDRRREAREERLEKLAPISEIAQLAENLVKEVALTEAYFRLVFSRTEFNDLIERVKQIQLHELRDPALVKEIALLPRYLAWTRDALVRIYNKDHPPPLLQITPEAEQNFRVHQQTVLGAAENIRRRVDQVSVHPAAT